MNRKQDKDIALLSDVNHGRDHESEQQVREAYILHNAKLDGIIKFTPKLPRLHTPIQGHRMLHQMLSGVLA